MKIAEKDTKGLTKVSFYDIITPSCQGMYIFLKQKYLKKILRRCDMIYKNSDSRVIAALESARLDDYEEESKVWVCPVCGFYEPDSFYINDNEECVGCSACVYSSEYPY